ncbi:OB-fold domain-containing protein [Bradyrhizobium sp. 1]|uniref:Zn-ribbon domain-containing OB-fold protein n=1 Tax=Bradyrhizobium sp. 1 TaxID=241591 RepID=UPI001FF86851|nr:OB-fold domain-containing protein [Bradyrhizobium sp. 1]MCK1394456.1 OB-fold domain-containing protein [Bradyrhizobium sp. 1]
MTDAAGGSSPLPDRDVAPFWRSKGGRLLIQACEDCNKSIWYPRPHCPDCFGQRLKWREASGRGEIYACSVTRRGVPEPYAIAYVALSEGPRILTNIVGCELDKLKIGMPVEVVFRDGKDGPVPCFQPIEVSQ